MFLCTLLPAVYYCRSLHRAWTYSRPRYSTVSTFFCKLSRQISCVLFRTSHAGRTKLRTVIFEYKIVRGLTAASDGQFAYGKAICFFDRLRYLMKIFHRRRFHLVLKSPRYGICDVAYLPSGVFAVSSTQNYCFFIDIYIENARRLTFFDVFSRNNMKLSKCWYDGGRG